MGLFFVLFPVSTSSAKIPLPDIELTGLPNVVKSEDQTVQDTHVVADGNQGHRILGSAVESIIAVIRNFLGLLAIVMMIYSALLLMTAGDKEDQLSKGKNGIVWAAFGLILALMAESVILDVFYGGHAIAPGAVFDTAENTNLSVESGIKLTLELIEWAKGIVIIAAVGFVLYSGLRMIFALGNAEEISKNKTIFLWVGLGIVVILINNVIVEQVLYKRVLGNDYVVEYTPDASRGIVEIISVVRYFLKFLAILAFLALIYGGALMISAFGDEEKINTGKKAITGAGIGIILILISFVLVSTFISGQVKVVE